MNASMTAKAPTWFTIVAVLALLWNLLGVLAFFMQVMMPPDALALLPEDQQELYRTVPNWALAGFACAVFGGALGSLGLVLKKAWAVPLLGLSVVGIVVQQTHSFFMSKTFEVLGSSAMAMPIMVLVIALLLLWLGVSAKKKLWLR